MRPLTVADVAVALIWFAWWLVRLVVTGGSETQPVTAARLTADR